MDRDDFLKILMKIGRIDSCELEEYVGDLDKEFDTAEMKSDGMRWVKLKGKNLEVSRDIYGGKEFYRILIRV